MNDLDDVKPAAVATPAIEGKGRTRRPVTVRALEARVKRYLALSDERLCKSRVGSRAEAELGEYYIVDSSQNFVVASSVDLESVAREWEVLADWEYVAEAA